MAIRNYTRTPSTVPHSQEPTVIKGQLAH
uniref:Biopterin-dependent aromatic amino acid hydroxylase family profile domain-containing protein n=1 Tax=Arundo donax TaxID=35708 RepID=A0A0A9CGY3_ARUDO